MSKLRLCYITDKKRDPICKALFHCWEHVAEIVEPSLMIGGHQGGVVQGKVAIVEYEDGTVHRHSPERIQFADDTSELFNCIPDLKEATDDGNRE